MENKNNSTTGWRDGLEDIGAEQRTAQAARQAEDRETAASSLLYRKAGEWQQRLDALRLRHKAEINGLERAARVDLYGEEAIDAELAAIERGALQEAKRNTAKARRLEWRRRYYREQKERRNIKEQKAKREAGGKLGNGAHS
jgi:hypothetical protein